MKKQIKILCAVMTVLLLMSFLCISAFAVTEGEVQAQVDKRGKDAVTGSIFVWFLCAIAFLKVSQKIDSFLSGLGIHVGNTGGSMLAEALIATKGVFAARQFAGGSRGGSGGGSSGGSGFMSGGLAGVVGRGITNSGVKKATGKGGGGIGGKAYTSSVGKGGSFANSVIGRVATGNISSVGSITGNGSEAALLSYLGYAALGPNATGVPGFSDVEIGGGRIMATETSATHPNGIQIGMYHADKYMKPSGAHSVVTAADGTTWYKQYAQDAVERTPYTASNGSVAYRESIVKRLPSPPPRKDRV